MDDSTERELSERENQYADILWWDMVHDVSMDSVWRERLFDAEPEEQKFEFNKEDLERLSAPVREKVKQHRLRFGCFSEGWADGACVFGIFSVEFPELVAYSTNYPP